MQRRRRKRKERQHAAREAEEAWEALERGEMDLALRIFRRNVERVADSPALWTDYARLLAETGRLRDAEKAVRRALVIAPGHAEGYAVLSQILARMGLSIEAFRAQRTALELRPGVPLWQETLEHLRTGLPPDHPEHR